MTYVRNGSTATKCGMKHEESYEVIKEINEINNYLFWYFDKCSELITKLCAQGPSLIEEKVVLREQISQQLDTLKQIKTENKRLRNENNIANEEAQQITKQLKQKEQQNKTKEQEIQNLKIELTKQNVEIAGEIETKNEEIKRLMNLVNKLTVKPKHGQEEKQVSESEEAIAKYMGDAPISQIKDTAKELKMKENEIKKMKNEIAQYKEKLEAVVREKEDNKRTLQNLNEYLDKIKEVNESLEIQLREMKDEDNKQRQAMQKGETNKQSQGKQENKEVNNHQESRNSEKTRDDGEKMQENSSEQKKTKQCWNYQRYKECKYGTECKFEHVNYQRKECKYHREGSCRYGDKCRFNHTEGNESSVLVGEEKRRMCIWRKVSLQA